MFDRVLTKYACGFVVFFFNCFYIKKILLKNQIKDWIFFRNMWCSNLIFMFRDGLCLLFGTHDTTFYPDKFADREIKQLTVICENKENGCTWSDILGNYEVFTKSLNNAFSYIFVELSELFWLTSKNLTVFRIIKQDFDSSNVPCIYWLYSLYVTFHMS